MKKLIILTTFLFLSIPNYALTEEIISITPNTESESKSQEKIIEIINKIKIDDEKNFDKVNSELFLLSSELKKDISSLRLPWWEKFIPAFIGVMGVLIGSILSGWFSNRSQSRQLIAAEFAANKATANEALSKITDFQSKQLNEFYAPIRFMLQRTGVVRQQLCEMLVEHPEGASKFYFKTENNRTHLYLTSSDKPFRLIHEMHDLATKFPAVIPLVGEIIAIGDQISKLIYEKGGLAKADNFELSIALGKYLGHYSILKEIYSKALLNPQSLIEIKYSMGYPRELDNLLEKDAGELTRKITNWEISARKNILYNI